MILLLLACSDMSLSSDVGIDPGGSQDIGYARQIIESGGIPSTEAFSAEGLFSEHDLPMEGGECDQLLCPLAKAAWTDPVDGSGERFLMQLGFDTFMTDFERRDLRLMVALDVSGSMGESFDQTTKMAVMKEALQTMVDQLGPDDQLGLVVFDSDAATAMPLTRMDETGRAAFLGAMRGLNPGSGTTIDAGLELAIDQLERVAELGGTEDRVMLLTDAQPNIDATGTGAFLDQARDAAELGIGLSVMGVGLDFGSELSDAMAKVRGGNAYYLDSQSTIDRVFGDDFAYMVSPAAYDLDVQIEPVDGLRFAEAYGVPIDGALGTIGFGASTLFFSQNDGGMGATLAPTTEALPKSGPIAALHLSYEDASTGDVREETIEAVWQGGVGGYASPADDLGPYKMAVLVDEYQAMTAAANFCTGAASHEEAMGQIVAAAQRLDARSAELGDDPLGAEAILMGKLGRNVQGGQGNCAPADAAAY